MRVAILGAGANGAGIAADLIHAGTDVTIIDQWPANVEAIRRTGITVEMPERTVVTSARAIHLCGRRDQRALRHRSARHEGI